MAERAMTVKQVGRYYEHPTTKERQPSVSTVLGAMDKPALDAWKVRTAVEYAVDNVAAIAQLDRKAAVDLCKGAQFRGSDTGKQLGTAVHSVIEKLARGGTVRRTDNTGPVIDAWEGFTSEYDVKILEIEQTVWNEAHRFAGSFDLLAEVDGVCTVIDAKSTRSGIWGETALQTAAYAMSPTLLRPDGTEDPMPEVEATAALWVRPHGWALHPLVYDASTRTAVKAIAAVFHWQQTYMEQSVLPAANTRPITR